MTNKEKLDKLVAEIKGLRKEVKDNIAELGNSESERIGLFKDLEIYDNILSFIDSMQEEPTTSVWHSANETPTDKSKVIVWLGEELNEIVQCHYMYGKFVEKIPTEEYGRYVLVGNAIEGYSRQFVSNKKRADLTELVVKWAYIDDLIKL